MIYIKFMKDEKYATNYLWEYIKFMKAKIDHYV